MSSKRQIYWEKIGKDYRLTWEKGARNYISRLEENFVKKFLSAGPKNNLKVLDLGCGTGRITAFLEENPKVKRISVVDGSKQMIGYVTNRFKKSLKVEGFILADISKRLPFKNNSFDFIATVRAIKYNQNWSSTLAECYRVLKKGGGVVFDMPNQDSLNRFSSCEAPIYKTTEKELIEILKNIGFTILEIKGGPVLPGFVYDKLAKNRFILKLTIIFEKLFKKIFGETFLSRYLYFACRR